MSTPDPTPVFTPQNYPNQGQLWQQGYGGQLQQARNGFGIAALVLGILAVFTSTAVVGGGVALGTLVLVLGATGGGVVLGVLAIVLGLIGRNGAIRGEATNAGAALAGIITGAVGAGLSLVVVVLGLVLGGLASGVSHQLAGAPSDLPLPSLQLDATGGVIVPGAPAATTGSASAVMTPAVTGATVFSPGGTADHPVEAQLAVDGNPATVWPTDQYNFPFPRLKNGVGLLLDLGMPSSLSKVGIDSPSPGTVVEIRSSPTANPQLGDTTVLATATLTAGHTDIPVTVAAPVHHVLVWITTLAVKGGKNQSSLGEITLTP